MTPEEVRRELTGTVFGSVRFVARTGSTNADLLAAARSGAPEGVVLVADHQTAGRGRRGRSWVAPPGAALLASALLRPGDSGVNPALLSPATALAVHEACAALGAGTQLKWPNDVIVAVPEEPPGAGRPSVGAGVGGPADGGPGTATQQAKPPGVEWHHEAKLAGVLAELQTGPRGGLAVVLGFGVNLRSQAALTTAVATEAGSGPGSGFVPLPPVALEAVVAQPPERDELLVSVLLRLDAWYRRLGESQGRRDLVGALRRNSATLGREVRVLTPGGPVEGRAEDLTEDGNLVVATTEGSVMIAAGDCHHLRSERA